MRRAGRGELERDAIRCVVALGVLALVLAAVWGFPRAAEIRDSRRYPVSEQVLAAARTQLLALSAGAASAGSRHTGEQIPAYDRAAFGTAWFDVDANGCDTRNDVLARDLNKVSYTDESHGCQVASGVLNDPYTERQITFRRGATSGAVQIDHVVALSNAWYSGAWQWSAQVRLKFANDPLNLLAVSGGANQDKGSAAADGWLPPNRGYICRYAVRQVLVKYSYGLSVTAAEAEALDGALARCHTH